MIFFYILLLCIIFETGMSISRLYSIFIFYFNFCISSDAFSKWR